MPTTESEIVTTVVAALIAATVIGYLVTFLRLPTIVGFLLAGVALSPFTPGYSADPGVADQLASVGVILLMFGVGMQFSIQDLLTVQRIALPGAIIHTLAVTTIVAAPMYFWDWSLGASLMIGLAISNPSTILVVRVLSDRNVLTAAHGRATIGWMIVEDIIAVFILVLAPALAATGDQTLLRGIGIATFKMVVLGMLTVIVGTRIVPRILAIVARTGSREVFTVTVLAIALAIAYSASTVFDVSIALGAFLAGLVISGSELSHQVATHALPFQDAFTVLFFVSIGMIFDPASLINSPLPLMLILLIIVLIKPLITSLMFLVYRFTIESSLLIGASRAQTGELALVIANLGLSIGVLVEDDISLILATVIVSLISVPLSLRVAESAAPVVEAIMPRDWPDSDPAIGTQDQQQARQPRGHAVVLGYDWVGSVIGGALRRFNLPFVAVENDWQRAQDIQAQGVQVIYGDASSRVVLEQLNLNRARVLVVALPDPIVSRIAVERARAIAPNLPVVIRTKNSDDSQYFENLENCEIVSAERELTIEMIRYALRRFGLSSTELQTLLDGLRSS